jgi:hypothetical protein
VDPSYFGGGGSKIMSLRPTRAKLAKPYLKNKLKAKGLLCGVSRRAVEALNSMSSATERKTERKKERKKERKLKQTGIYENELYYLQKIWRGG